MKAIFRGAAALLLLAGAAEAQPARELVVAVDRDDDDANGAPDVEDARVAPSPELAALPGHGKLAMRGEGDVRVLADGRPVVGGDVSGKRIEAQGLRPGRVEIVVGDRTTVLQVIGVRAIDGAGNAVDLARSHASFERTPPERLGDDPMAASADTDALRFELAADIAALPAKVTIASIGASGAEVDALVDVALTKVPCAAGTPEGIACASTVPIRVVSDEIDRSHPLVVGRSVRAELGGAVAVVAGGRRLQAIRVGGPRVSAVGPMGRYRAKARVVMVRATRGGATPMGTDAASATKVAIEELRRANQLWGACGITFGPPADVEVIVADPPRPHLVALGCDLGLPASGGALHLRVDGRDVSAKLAPGATPYAAARVLAAAITQAGFVATPSDNARIAAGALGTSDVLVRRKDGSLASIEPPASGAVSTDATMTACIGHVELEDGLDHFGDIDAIAGTVEERTLVKAFADGDPSTVTVFLVTSFAGGGRIGESFIAADGGSVRNVVIEDRAGVRADRASYALAHELGHVLLDEPGHPDDFGVDTPTRLMDADAANPSAYGPRRLLVTECARALRQSGPTAPVPLLTAWPFAPIGKDR